MNRFRRAFSLTEMLFAIALMAIAFTIEGQLFSQSLHTISDTSTAENGQAQLRQMLSSLQSDVWSASEIQIPDAKTINLTQSSGAAARWKLSDGMVERELENGGTKQKWAIPLPLVVEQGGRGTLVLRSNSPHYDARLTRRFSSQLILAGEFK